MIINKLELKRVFKFLSIMKRKVLETKTKLLYFLYFSYKVRAKLIVSKALT